MKKYSLFLAFGSIFFAANVFADQLKFNSNVVSTYTVGSAIAPTATLTSTTGSAPVTTVVILPKTIAVKDLKMGDVVFLPAPHNSVFKILNVTTDTDGSLVLDVEDTFLSIKPGRLSTTPNTVTTPSTMTTPSTITTPTTTTSPAKTGGY